ncbi:MAG: acyl-CoA carboxylase subunit epsilon [Microbacteriaceae bacterium]|jgi:Acyl-CoA carboxylase epsilon subunit|nr:acyl-CoA carboxylase subunit epsilon [Microbacteriaceae bacterium]
MSESIDKTIKVISGNPTPEELAAVIAILEASHREQTLKAKAQAPVRSSSWSRNTTQLRGDLRPGHGQWQAAFRAGLE